MNQITLNKEVIKNLSKENYYDDASFIADAQCYIQAVEDGRLLYAVVKVSANGMSRSMLIRSCEKDGEGFYFRNYVKFMKVMGYKILNDLSVRVNGGGMNMLFETNYGIINALQAMGFLPKERADKLAQKIR